MLRLGAPAETMPTMLLDPGSKDTSELKEVPDVTPWGTMPIDGINGDLLATAYYTKKENGHKQLVLIRSKDPGKSWDEYGTIATAGMSERLRVGWAYRRPRRVALVRLANQQIYAVFRTGSDALMGQSWSSDDGKTWTPPVPTDVKGVAPHLRS